MAVAPAQMADKIIILDLEEDESPQLSGLAPRSSSQPCRNKPVSALQARQPVTIHATPSPFASSKKQTDALQAENQKLFKEFLEHCSELTQDCPQVLSFLETKHSKACPDFLSSVEFRNNLGRCLTRAQAHRSKTFVYIKELCTVLRQHAAKRRQSCVKVEAGLSSTTSDSPQSTSGTLRSKSNASVKVEEQREGAKPVKEQPSTSGLQENHDQEQQQAKKRANRKQIAYLENLLKLYNKEICRLQQAELSLDDLEAEDSSYIQENKLKRKMMKIYEKLCELKGCSTLTGRAIEQKIHYKSTRYPEISRRIERFINSPEVRMNPPDYPDIRQQVLLANKRYNLQLDRKQLTQMAQEAFRETGSQIQERRHLDLLYNFGSHLTDNYSSARDPALSDPGLLRKLRSNREVALSRLEDVITKYAGKQEDTEEQERMRRQEKDNKEGQKSDQGQGTKEANGVAAAAEDDNDEEDEDEEDESSDPDIEEEIRASTQQDGPDDDDKEEDEGNEVEPTSDGLPGSVSAGEDERVKDEEEDEEPATNGGVKDEQESINGFSPLSEDSQSQSVLSPSVPPCQSEPPQPERKCVLMNGERVVEEEEEPVHSSSPGPVLLVSNGPNTPADASPVTANGRTDPVMEDGGTQVDNSSLPPPDPRTTSLKRKRNKTPDRDVDVPPSRAESPDCELVSSSQTTPPPKKNKVNVATQCDPQEIIVLSDSE